MSVSKKDFKAVAEAIRIATSLEMNGSPEKADAGKELAVRLADYFANQNPFFDRAKWFAACGVGT